MFIAESPDDIAWQYRNGFISFSEAVVKLIRLGLTSNKIDALMAL
jgi:hypothetical protein